MRNSFISLLLILIFILPGCKDDNNITSSNYNFQLAGKWKFLNSDDPSGWEQINYLILNPDNFYYFLLNYDYDRHYIMDDVYSVTGNLIDLGSFGLFKWKITGDTLKLIKSDFTLSFVRFDSAPTEKEWIIPLTIEKEIQLPEIPRITDITFDGSFLWAAAEENGIFKLDTMGNVVSSFPLINAFGITYSNNYLWISKADTLKKVDPVNGNVILSLKVNYFTLGQLAYADGFIWVRNYEYLKINEVSGEIADTIYSLNGSGLEIKEGKIWTFNDQSFYSIDPDSGRVSRNYSLPADNYYSFALTNGGNGFWIIGRQYNGSGYFQNLKKVKYPDE